MSEYRVLFDARGARYNRANRLYPEARAEEAERLFRFCEIHPGGRWFDLGAGGGFLAARAAARGLRAAAVGGDESATFLADATGYALKAVVEYGRLPFRDDAFSASACLAALHHAEQPRRILGEMLRVTARSGRSVVGDVVAGSPASEFLNGFVDEHTDAGHAGRFYRAAELAAHLEAAGGRDVRAEEVTIAWRFAERDDPRIFFRELFGLRPGTRDAEIEAALAMLGLWRSGDSWVVPWTMVYASAARR